MRGKITYFFVMLTASLLLFPGCEPKPRDIGFGSDQCDYCRMMITEPEFGSQVVNRQGRPLFFDSIECMAAYHLTNDRRENIHSSWVPDFQNRGEWLAAESAVYLHSETLRSPMGLNLSAYSDSREAEQMLKEYGGDLLDFEKLLRLVKEEWFQNGQTHSQGG